MRLRVENICRRMLVPMVMVGVAITCCSGSVALGQVQVDREIDDDGVEVNTYRLALVPAAKPRPKFRWRLTVLPHQTFPGNAATHYLRSLGEGTLDRIWNGFEETFGREEMRNWYFATTPLSDLPLEELKPMLSRLDDYVDEHIRRASICRYADWGLAEEELRGLDLFLYPMSEIQDMRRIARLLILRTRLAIAEQRFEDAVDHLRMNYQLANHVGQMKFVMSQLVAMGIVRMSNESLYDWFGGQGAPNLYWALAELPRPIVDLRQSVRFETSVGLRAVPELLDVTTLQLTDDEWSRRYHRAMRRLHQIEAMVTRGEIVTEDAAEPWRGTTSAMGNYPAAKQRLIESGGDAGKIEQMPPGQVLLIDIAEEYQKLAHRIEVALYLAPLESRQHWERIEADLDDGWIGIPDGKKLAAGLLPAFFQVRNEQLRLDAQLNALQTIESLRNHLAEHGQFPDTLEQLRLPAPRNPFTEAPFEYSGQPTSAVLEIPHVDGLTTHATRFILRIADTD